MDIRHGTPFGDTTVLLFTGSDLMCDCSRVTAHLDAMVRRLPKDYDCAIATPNSAAAIAASKLIPPSVPTAAARFAGDEFRMSGVIQ